MLTNGHGPVDRARAIAPIIAGESESIDRVARLTSAALAALVDANLFRACAPSEIGGNGCDLRDAASIAGILGSADVSTGWLFVQANSSSFNFGPRLDLGTQFASGRRCLSAVGDRSTAHSGGLRAVGGPFGRHVGDGNCTRRRRCVLSGGWDQDLHVMSQQLFARPSHFENIGRYMLGLDHDRTLM